MSKITNAGVLFDIQVSENELHIRLDHNGDTFYTQKEMPIKKGFRCKTGYFTRRIAALSHSYA